MPKLPVSATSWPINRHIVMISCGLYKKWWLHSWFLTILEFSLTIC